jgi:flagellar biosynthesis protein FlhA
MLESLRVGEQGAVLAVDPDTAQTLLTSAAQFAQQAEDANRRAVLVCAPQLRAAVRRLVAPALPRLPVLSYTEIAGAASVHSVGVISTNRGANLTAVPA